MIGVRHHDKFDGRKIPVDRFWNVGEERELKIHRIHGYPAKFPAFLTTKSIEYCRKVHRKPKRIADVFCGCGTVAFESKRSGIDFWGCDLNPVATLIARAKSNDYTPNLLEFYYTQILSKFTASRFEGPCYFSASERLKYWYDARAYRDLWKLKSCIEDTVGIRSKYHEFFIVAFSNILKPTSRWLTKSIKPQVDPNKARIDVIESFKRQCGYSILAYKQRLSQCTSEVVIETADFLSQNLFPPQVDLVITSPPYVTSYEYADLHQLSTLWLFPNRDYRAFRKGSIGSLHHGSNLTPDLDTLNKTGRCIVTKLATVDRRKANSVAKYFVDMQDVALKTRRMLRNRGLALFVIGNTSYSEVLVDNCRHLIESMYVAGYSDVKVAKRNISKKILTPYRDNRGRFTTNSSGHRVYSEEFIVVGRP